MSQANTRTDRVNISRGDRNSMERKVICVSPIKTTGSSTAKFVLYKDQSLGVKVREEFGYAFADLGSVRVLEKIVKMLKTRRR